MTDDHSLIILAYAGMIQTNIGSVVNSEKLESRRVACVLANDPKSNHCISRKSFSLLDADTLRPANR